MLASPGNPLSTAAAPNEESGRERSARAALLAILLIGLAIRLTLWFGCRNDPIHIWDERDYHALAVNLVEHGEYTFQPGGTPTSLRPPLYPAFVAGIYSLFGVENVAAVRFAQIILSLLTVLVAYRLALEATSQRVANWTAALVCFYPSLLIYNNLLLSETLFTLLLTSACWMLVRGLTTSSLGWTVLSGVLLALAALTRSAVWLAPPFVALFLLLTWTGPRSQRWVAAALFIAAFAVTIAPWSIRNSRLQQTFVAIDVMGGRNFMMGNFEHTPLYRSWDAIALEGEKSWAREIETTYPPEARRTQGFVDKLAFRQGLAFVQAHPLLSLQRSIVKFFDFWGLEREIISGGNRGFFGAWPKPALIAAALLIAGSYAAALLLAIFGAAVTPPDDRRVHWFLICVVAFLCGVHTVVFGHSRYHLPLAPIILIYTALALTNLGSIWQRRRSPRFAIATCLCLVVIASWAWMAIVVDGPQIAAMLGLTA